MIGMFQETLQPHPSHSRNDAGIGSLLPARGAPAGPPEAHAAWLYSARQGGTCALRGQAGGAGRRAW